VTRLWAGSLKNRDSVLGRTRDLSSKGSGVHVSSCLMMLGLLSVGFKQPGREPDHKYLPS
jgi:hypothetical protein